MAVTVSGGGTTVLVFNVVTGTAGGNFANDFSGAVGTPSIVSVLSSGQPESTTPGALNVIYDSSSSAGTFLTYALTTPDQYTYVSVGQPTTVDGSGSGDTLFGGAALTYTEAATGGDNRVVFTSGNNVFQGSSSGGAGDTIVGGSGYDTIVTGTGTSTVYSGTGHTLIELNDTIAGDIAVLQSGNSTVVANGVSDTVNASATGTVFGGSGLLTFVAAPSTSPLAVSVVGGTGVTNMFGASGTDLTFAGGGTATYIAGDGNETLNGFNSSGFAFFGDTSATDANYSVVGGAGTDYFSTGAGTEFFQAGFGVDSFNISTVPGATITIADFSTADSISFNSTIASQSTDGANYSVTLSDGTTVEFLGITSLPTHHT
jgi:hypothetical protein